jgi:hypothetical protein
LQHIAYCVSIHRSCTPSTDIEKSANSYAPISLRHPFNPDWTKPQYAKMQHIGERFFALIRLIEMKRDQERKLYLISIYNNASTQRWHPGSPKFL